MGSGTVAVLCDHDLLAAGPRVGPGAALAGPAGPGVRADELAAADVLVVDVDDPRLAEVVADATATRVVAWTWHADGGAGTTPSVAVTLPKQADGATTLAALDEALRPAAA